MLTMFWMVLESDEDSANEMEVFSQNEGLRDGSAHELGGDFVDE